MLYKAEEARKIRAKVLASQQAVWDKIRANSLPPLQGFYDVFVIDPPWPLRKMVINVHPQAVGWDYPTMPLPEIEALVGQTVQAHAASAGAHVFLWTTHRFLPHAFPILKATGARYSCTFTWKKPNGVQPFGCPKFNSEFVLYGRVGKPSFSETKRFYCAFDAPQRGHSIKPSEFYETIQRVTNGARRLDMFGRRVIPGFKSWGLEAPHQL